MQSSQSELKALRAQINPHFLFNALNTVASLIHSDPARADRAVEQLSEVFRHTLRRSESEWAPLDQELAFAAAYLDVEEARFGVAAALRDRRRPRRRPGAGAVDARAHAGRERRQARHRAGARPRHARGDRPRRRRSPHRRGARQRSGARRPRRRRRASRAGAGEQFGLRSVRDRLRGPLRRRGQLHAGARRRARAHRGADRAAGRGARRPAQRQRRARCRRDPRRAGRRRGAGAGPAARPARGDRRGRRWSAKPATPTRPAPRWRRCAPDVVFLDIEMPAERGTDLAATLPEPRPFIVFATAYERFAVDAFQYDAADYLLKPVNRQRLQATLRPDARQAGAAGGPPRASSPRRPAPRRTCCRSRCPRCPATCWRPARWRPAAVGGDFYDAVLAGDHLAFVLGDVAGKGMAAGLVASSVQARWQAAMQQRDLTLAGMMTALNARRLPLDRRLALRHARARRARAGHRRGCATSTPGIRRRSSSPPTARWRTGPRRHGAGARALRRRGRFPPPTLVLAPGDTLVVMSDGVSRSARRRTDASSSWRRSPAPSPAAPTTPAAARRRRRRRGAASPRRRSGAGRRHRAEPAEDGRDAARAGRRRRGAGPRPPAAAARRARRRRGRRRGRRRRRGRSSASRR